MTTKNTNIALMTDQGFNTPFNLSLVVSAAASALTVALKGIDGNDPSATNPISIPFRDVTLATGTPTWLSVTAATSLVITSGATMGVTSATAFRLWVVGFNDGGTFRLGLINCSTCTTTACSIFSLIPWAVASSTAVTSAGDSAGVFYTGTAVTSKAYAILGFIEWSASGLTAGTWTTTNLNRIQLFGPGVPRPGQIIQLNTTTTIVATTFSTNAFVASTNRPSITPQSAANLIRLVGYFRGTNNNGGNSLNIQWSRGTTNNTNMIGSSGNLFGIGGEVDISMVCCAIDKPNTTSSQTYALQGLEGTAAADLQSTPGYIEISEIMG